MFDIGEPLIVFEGRKECAYDLILSIIKRRPKKYRVYGPRSRYKLKAITA